MQPAHPALIVPPAPDVADIMKIRTAEPRDLAELLDIYNYEVEHGTATLDIQPRTQAQWEAWFFAHNIENHPLIVAEKNGNIAGYASLSAYRQKEADGAVFSIKNVSERSLAIENGSVDDLTERFIRGDSSRTTEGSGLGLSIAKNLTVLMGGQFDISVDGDLFKATIILPMHSEEEQENEE